MWKYRLGALFILILGALLGWYLYNSEISGSRPFRLGLDLSGGTQLLYKADLSAIPGGNVDESMNALRDTIERRVNIFGVAEPLVQTEKGGALAGESQQRLIVELPGVTDTEKAIAMIGATPTLEFRLLKEDATAPADGTPVDDPNTLFEPATVTGKHVERAELQFGNAGGLANEPDVGLPFNHRGQAPFCGPSPHHGRKSFGIFLDGVPISTPVIRE